MLAGGRTLVRYDPRGSGLSDRNVDDFSLEAWISDLSLLRVHGEWDGGGAA